MSLQRRSLMNSKSGNNLPNYLTFEAIEDSVFTMTIPSNTTLANYSYVEYSIDGGSTWVKTNNVASTTVTVTTPTITAGNKVHWRGNGRKIGQSGLSNMFTGTGKYKASGLLTSLLNGAEASAGDILSESHVFTKMFKNDTNIVDASGLIFPSNVIESTYEEMFYGCTSLVLPPAELPATTVTMTPSYGRFVYQNMFYGCTSLKNAPRIRLTGYEAGSCRFMFRNCTSLESNVDIEAISVHGDNVMGDMFRGCTKLKSVRFINSPSDFNNVGSLLNMFRDCTALESVSGLSNFIYIGESMFHNCLALKTIDIDYSKIQAVRVNAFAQLTKGVFTGFTGNIDLPSCTVIGTNGNSGGTSTLPHFNATKYILPKLTEMWNNPFSGSNYKNNDLIAVVAPKVVTINHFRYGGPFANITTLELVDIGDAVTTIGTLYGGNGMFGSAATNFVCRATTVPTLGDGLGTLKAIYVPSSAVNDYKTANNWSGKSSIIYAIGGAEWTAEFGSSDPYADYDKYNISIN